MEVNVFHKFPTNFHLKNAFSNKKEIAIQNGMRERERREKYLWKMMHALGNSVMNINEEPKNQKMYIF